MQIISRASFFQTANVGDFYTSAVKHSRQISSTFENTAYAHVNFFPSRLSVQLYCWITHTEM